SEENAASLRNYLQPSLGLPCAVDTESTLSNVTSIQSQLQSLYETCHDPLKIYQSLQQQQQQQPTTQIHSSDKTSSHLQKALDKHTQLLQELKFQQQHQFKTNQTTSQTNNPATYVLSPAKGAATSTGGTAAGGVSGKTATILVSKSKTKTGLPLLLKNSINN
ncbi:uncharacterized protein LOC119611447, partial [Lucilia sericata]|uniref:uncharacterized protein LOC119611447 n=1 Tax=Lucilia sericata TaxID=13632 RepID=UPI0018A80DAA